MSSGVLHQTTLRAPRSLLVSKALGWGAAGAVLSALIAFLRSPILARLLTPADYGIFSLLTAVTSSVAVLTGFTLSSSVVVRVVAPTAQQDTYSAIWTFDFLRGLCMSLVLLLAAYPAAMYFEDQRLFPLLVVAALGPTIAGARNVGLDLHLKNLRLKQLTIYRVSSELAATGIVIALAWRLRSVWALVIGSLAGALISSALSYSIHPFRPRFHLDRAALSGSLGFAAGVFVAGLCTFVTSQLDNVVVGRLAGLSSLGIYAIAYRLCEMPLLLLSSALREALFPTFASLHNDNDRAAIMRYLQVATAGSLTLLALLFLPLAVLRHEAVMLLWGAKWLEAAPLIPVLALLSLFRGIAHAVGPFLIGLQRPDLDAKAKVAEAIAFCALLFFLVPSRGALGAALAGLTVYFLAAVARLAFVRYLLGPIAWRMITPLTLFTALSLLAYSLAEMISSLSSAPIPSALALISVLGFLSLLAFPSLRTTAAAYFPAMNPKQ